MLEQIKRDLGQSYQRQDDFVLLDLIEEYTLIASDTTNRNKDDCKLCPYVKRAVKSAYLLRGNEGMKTRAEGSISTSYEDIEEKLRNDLIKNGLRLLK